MAVSDPLSITAQGVETIHTRGTENDILRVRELCGQYLTDRVLVGLPRTLGGEEGFQGAGACAGLPTAWNCSASTSASRTSG